MRPSLWRKEGEGGIYGLHEWYFFDKVNCLIEVNHVQGVRDLWERPLLRPQCQSCQQQDEACLVSEPAKDEGSEEQ